MMNLFSLLCKHHLVEELYPAKVAGLSYYLFSLEKGFVLQVYNISYQKVIFSGKPQFICFQVNGYNEKLHLLVEKIVNCMINLKENMRESVFNIFKVQLAKNLFNIMIKPGNLNKDVRLGIVQKVHFANHAKFNVLPSVTFEDMQQFVENIFDEVQIQALVQGNVSRATAERLSEAVVSQFKLSRPIKDVIF
jgi:nardilysin